MARVDGPGRVALCYRLSGGFHHRNGNAQAGRAVDAQYSAWILPSTKRLPAAMALREAHESSGRSSMDAQQSTQQAAQQLAKDVKAVVDDAEALLRSTAEHTGEEVRQLRESLQRRLKEARASLVAAEERVVANVKEAAAVTDRYVRDNPWQAVGISAGIGAGIGFLLGLLVGRK